MPPVSPTAALCEGQPEAKPQARGAFGAYMRDPDGHKLGIYSGLTMGG